MHAFRGPALQAEAVRLALEGHRPAQIATALNRRPGTIAAALSHARATGLRLPVHRPGPAPGSLVGRRVAADARRAKIAAMSAEGMPVAEIAAKLGCSVGAIATLRSRMRQARALA